MSRYIISPDAIRDLEEITDYFAIHNVDAGDRLLNEFAKTCRYLTQFPHIGRTYREIRPYLRGVLCKITLFFTVTSMTALKLCESSRAIGI